MIKRRLIPSVQICGLNRQLITKLDCHAAVCLTDEVQKCLWIQEETAEIWISLQQNIIDLCSHIGPTFWAILLHAVEKRNNWI